MSETPFDHRKRMDNAYLEDTARLIIDAYRRTGNVPNFDKVHRSANVYAKTVLKFSDKGARAWATLKCEELRRWLVAEIGEMER